MVDRLFAGNAFAVYDVERALFGTRWESIRSAFARGRPEKPLRAANTIREAGGIAAAVRKKV